jgi:hypothetical protein
MTASSAPSRTQRLRPSSTSRSSGPRLARAYCSSASSCSTGMFAVSRISMSYPLYMSQVVYLSQMTLADLTVIGQGEIRSDCRQTTSSRHAWTQPDKITIEVTACAVVQPHPVSGAVCAGSNPAGAPVEAIFRTPHPFNVHARPWQPLSRTRWPLPGNTRDRGPQPCAGQRGRHADWRM